jgi:glycine/D-amino acid oxidase-like deaminating enzyme
MPRTSDNSGFDPVPPGLPARPDILVVGAGVVGLWCALKAKQRGLSVVVAERGRIGHCASGGFLGALMPHRATNWTDMKAFQLEALLSLETEVGRLENLTGVTCGYRRAGRLMPVMNEARLKEHRSWQAAAGQMWPKASPSGQPVSWRILEEPPDPAWVAPGGTAVAYSFDTLSARINPRALTRMLCTALRPDVPIVEGCPVDPVTSSGTVTMKDGSRLSPGAVIIACGVDTFGLLEPAVGCRLGWGVKGEAVLLRPARSTSPDMPVAYHQGTYIVPHCDGLVAVGSTSETDYENAEATKANAQRLVADAAALYPALRGAAEVERWAGIRPRAAGRRPMVGVLPDAERTIVATGGFKITLGIGHRMAEAAVSFAVGENPPLPGGFDVESHLARVRQGGTGKSER